jgi:hypothetical protein
VRRVQVHLATGTTRGRRVTPGDMVPPILFLAFLGLFTWACFKDIHR